MGKGHRASLSIIFNNCIWIYIKKKSFNLPPKKKKSELEF